MKKKLNVHIKNAIEKFIDQVSTLKSRIKGSLSPIKPYFFCRELGGCGGGGRGNAKITLNVS